MKLKQKAASAVLIATMMCTQSPIVFAMQENATNLENNEVLTESINEDVKQLNTVDESSASIEDTIEENGITYEITKLPSTSTHGTVKLTNGNTASGDITIPSFITSNGKYDVTELADNAFKGNTALTRIDLSKTSVKKIGQYCFSGCTNLTEAKFTEDTAIYLTIDRRAFENCKALKELQFASVQITTNSALAFYNSGIEKITILNPLQFSRYAFSGLPSGFILNCPHKISTVSNLNSEMFGMTQNVTFLVPNSDLKSKMEIKFKSNSRVKVKLANEDVEDTKAVVKDNKGQVLSYASLDDAFKGINESSNEGPFMVYMSNHTTAIDWPATLPNKAVVIDFGQNQVNLPESITLQAPLTIKNVNNFTNSNLCHLNANEYAFVMENGGSFGFSEITGNHLTFKGRLPGSTPLGKQIQIKGYSENAQITFENIGRSNYYYHLPDIENFTNLELNDAYLSADAKQVNDLNISINDGGLQITGDTKVKSISGTGEIRLTADTSLIIEEKAEGKFVLPDYNHEDSMITVPVDSQIQFVDNEGNKVHAHSYVMNHDDQKHWLECGCGAKKDIEDHQGGKANCHKKAICDVCGEEYGDFDLENHDGETEVRGQIEAQIGQDGYTGDTYCLGCGQLLSKGEVIPALKEEPTKPTQPADKDQNVTVSIDKNNSQEQPSQKEEKTDSKVKTGDTSTIAMWIVTLLSALSGMIFIKKKDMIK